MEALAAADAAEEDAMSIDAGRRPRGEGLGYSADSFGLHELSAAITQAWGIQLRAGANLRGALLSLAYADLSAYGATRALAFSRAHPEEAAATALPPVSVASAAAACEAVLTRAAVLQAALEQAVRVAVLADAMVKRAQRALNEVKAAYREAGTLLAERGRY